MTSTLDTVLADATEAAKVAAAVTGSPGAAGVSAALGAVDGVTSAVEADQAVHASAVTTTADQAKANGIQAAIATLWAEFKAIF
jgi:NAD(P)H-dependent FMN reductase